MSVKRKAGGCYVTKPKRKVPRRAAPSTTRLTPTQKVFITPSKPRPRSAFFAGTQTPGTTTFSAGTQTPGTAAFSAGTQTPSTATFTIGTQTRRRRRRPGTLTLTAGTQTPGTATFTTGTQTPVPVVRVSRVGSVGVQTEPVLGPNAAALVVQNTIATQTQPQPSPAVYPPDVQLGLAAIDMAAQAGLSYIERDAMGRTPMEAAAQEREFAQAFRQRFMGQQLGLQQSLQDRRSLQFQVGTQTELTSAPGPLVTASGLQMARANLRPITQNTLLQQIQTARGRLRPTTTVLGQIEAGRFNLRSVGPPRIYDEVEESRRVQARFREQQAITDQLLQIPEDLQNRQQFLDFVQQDNAARVLQRMLRNRQRRQQQAITDQVLNQLERSPTRNTRRVLERLALREGLTIGQLLRRDYLDMSGIPHHRLPLGGQFCNLLQRNKFAFSQKGNLLQCRQERAIRGAARQRWYKVIDDPIVQLTEAGPSDDLLRRLSEGE